MWIIYVSFIAPSEVSTQLAMVGMVTVTYATLCQRWLQVEKPTVVFSTSAHRRNDTDVYPPCICRQ